MALCRVGSIVYTILSTICLGSRINTDQPHPALQQADVHYSLKTATDYTANKKRPLNAMASEQTTASIFTGSVLEVPSVRIRVRRSLHVFIVFIQGVLILVILLLLPLLTVGLVVCLLAAVVMVLIRRLRRLLAL